MRGIDTVGMTAAQLSPRRLDATSFPLAGVVTFASVVASATPGTPGAWTEVVASSVKGDCIRVGQTGTAANGTDTRTVVDVAFGAAAAEVAVMSSVCVGNLVAGMWPDLPLNVPAGTRISMRSTSMVASKATSFWVQVGTRFVNSLPMSSGSGGLDAYGVVGQGGTSLPTANTWVELTAATTVPYKGLWLRPTGADTTVTWFTEATVYSLGIGASGSEVTLAAEWYQSSASAEGSSHPNPGPVFYGHIPKGTRIAAKQSIGRGARGAAVYGMRY